MARHELLLFIFLTSCSNAIHHRNRIVTPNNGQTSNPFIPQGNINVIAMFPQLPSNSLPPDSNEGTTIYPFMTPAVPTSTNTMTTSDIATQTVTPPTMIVDTVTSVGGIVIKVEFPSSVSISVNVTSNGQPLNPSVNVSGKGTVEMPTVESTIGTSTVGGGPVEVSTMQTPVETSNVDATPDTSTVVTTETSTTQVTTDAPLDVSSTNSDPVEVSMTHTTVETSTVEATPDTSTVVITEISTTLVTTDTPLDVTSTQVTLDLSVTTELTTVEGVGILVENSTEMPIPDSTVNLILNGTDAIPTMPGSIGTPPTTENIVEVPPTETAVEVVNATNVESSPQSAPIYKPNPETMTQIQISIDLSDNSQNPVFGSTGLPIVPLQNKMIYKEKCEEYYAKSRAEREAKVQVFIVGGTSSAPKEFPHMAALGYGKEPTKEWLCGGSLISENYVITAAHCLSSSTLGEVQVVRMGTTILTETLNSQDYNVIRRIAHPDHSTNEQYNDIALLRLDRPVTFSEYIAPICLYSPAVTEEVLIATGWGKTEPTGDVSKELQKVELEYFPNKDCQDSYSGVSKTDLPKGIDATTQICAGSRTEQKDTCQGDSGGPLQIKDGERLYLVGITSFGIACGTPGRPGVYTRVSPYIPWIENIVWGSGK